MIDIHKIDFSSLDRPEVLQVVFHPRPEMRRAVPDAAWTDVAIPVEPGVTIGGRFHLKDPAWANILFFHGNGEIVADYDELGELYHESEVNFLPVDYRGYGRSGGSPTITAMLRDCHVVFEFTRDWLRTNGCSGPLILMGRSLGSAPALELAAAYPDRIAGLIIESGFAYAEPLLELLGVDVDAIGFREEEVFRNLEKIGFFHGPTLVIHAERDQIIPFWDGQALYDASPSPHKTLLRIPRADHNTIFQHGFSTYMAAVESLARQCASV